MTVAEFSVRQTVLVNILFFVCMLGGVAAFLRIPVEFFPDVNLNSVVITTVWTGASAEEVERLVTQKLEEEIGNISNIKEMRSTSQANLSEIVVDFDETLDDVEYEGALNDVRAALDRVDDLPDDMEEPRLIEIVTSEAFPAVILAVVDTSGVGETALREVARDIRSRIERIPGTSRVTLRGEQEREIRVLVDREAAARYGITALEIAERIRRHNLNLPAGTFSAEDGEATLRAKGDYETIDEILDTIVLERPGGTTLRVGEVARVEMGLEKRRFANRYNGDPCQLISVTKKDHADVIDLVGRIDEWIAGHRDLLPAGIELRKTVDNAAFVEPRMQILVQNLVSGIGLVMLILWFTIGFRNALLTSIAIPFSFLTAMILFPALDITINSNTLIGMLLVSGMLVDDAIIVIENIYRRIEAGEALVPAIIQGTNEVMWPVIAAVLTTCAAFAPLLLVEGTAGKFVSILPKAVIVCLVASLFECLIILPAHYLDFGSRGATGSRGKSAIRRLSDGIRGRVDGGLALARRGYVSALSTVLEHRFSFAMLLCAVLFFAMARSTHLPIDLFPGEFDTFNVMIESPSYYSLDQTDAVVRGVERQIAPLVGGDIVDYSTTVGSSVDANYDNLTGPNLSMTFLVMKSDDESRKQPERVLQRVREQLERYRTEEPDGLEELRVQAQQDGPPIGPPVEVRIQGDDYAIGKSIADEMKAFLHTLPGVYNIEDNLKVGPPEVRILLDETRASLYGLRFEDIALALRAANDGVVASSFRDPGLGEDIDIRVLLEGGDRRGLQELLSLDLQTPTGPLIELRDVADVEIERGFLSYRRYDEKRTVSVLAEIDENATTSIEVNERLKAAFANVQERFPDVEVRYGGEFEASNEAFANVFSVFPIAFLAIYMILAALFRSYLQPLVVCAAIPFGLVGVIIGVGLLDYHVSFILFYATIGLTGVVINDSLVMVDFINRERERGAELLDAVRESGAIRFRPILLTTLTTVTALLPMAFGLQGSSKTYGPFAAAISFGLVFAMVGSLFAVPLAYTSLIVWRERIGRWLGWPAPDEAERELAAKAGAGGGA